MDELRIGTFGAAVKLLQKNLLGLGFWPPPVWDEPDEFCFWVKTEQATKAFQKKHGLIDDGIVGPITRGAIEARVRRLQTKLYGLASRADARPCYEGAQDGVFGPDLTMAVRKFQSESRLPSTGRLDDLTRDRLRSAAADCFDDQFAAELELMESWKQQTGSPARSIADPIAHAHSQRLTGLALSGGGIRSATFNLGVIQTLAEYGLLRRVDYLSTVSGGGYIGGWLSAWISRENGKVEAVEKALALDLDRAPAEPTTARAEPQEITWLRGYSNFITPRLGLLGEDFLQGVATTLRNVLLNQYLLAAILTLCLLPPWLVAMFALLAAPVGSTWLFAAAGFVLVGVASFLLGRRSGRIVFDDKSCRLRGSVPRGITLAYAGAALCLGFAPFAFAGDPTLTKWLAGVGAASYAAPWLAGWCWAESGLNPGPSSKESWRAWWAGFRGALAGGFVLGLSVFVAAKAVGPAASDGILLATVFGLPGAGAVILLALTAHIGLAGRGFSESLREWWSRLGGLVIRICVVWLALASAVLLSPFAISSFNRWITAAGGFVWAATTIAGAVAGRSASSGGKSSKLWVEAIARVAPGVFVVGLMVLLSCVLYSAIGRIGDVPPQPVCQDAEAKPGRAAFRIERDLAKPDGLTVYEVAPESGCSFSRYATQFKTLARGGFAPPRDWAPRVIAPRFAWALAIIVFLASPWFFSNWIDVNIFSLHLFYRNRLERCYLGASRSASRRDGAREAESFTNLDSNDSPRLDALVQRPYPIVNTALNISNARNLAWQERKGASFTFTPLYCGYQFPDENGHPIAAFQRTADYVAGAEPKGWISLSMAITISGAAASPNWGYHTNPATAFLMTMFNVRLAWWMQNPLRPSVWREPGPNNAARWLLSELAGSTTSDSDYVYLSDGGHFENLALYELVRRRCRYIIACDAGADPKFEFEDLGNAIRKIRVDFGIEIEIDVRPLIPDPRTGRSQFHCAVGKIHYQLIDPSAQPGYLLYVKPTLCGQEPTDLKQYHAMHAAFPHEPTADQWFSESQFESYRKLGWHIARRVLLDSVEAAKKLDAPAGSAQPVEIEELFRNLAERWFPPSAATQGAFAARGETVARIFERLRTDPRLRFMDAQIYPEWPHMTDGKSETPRREMMLPDSYAEVRAGFYLCNQLFQLMENVYHDLNLEAEHDHPDNRGWMNLFRHWSWSGMFRVAWAVSASTYGARFQTFCREQLGLEGKEFARVCVDRELHFRDEHLLQLKSKEPDPSGALINFLERSDVRKVRDHFKKSCTDVDQAEIVVIPLQLGVKDPMAIRPDDKLASAGAGVGPATSSASDDEPSFKFTFGVAVIDKRKKDKPELVYFRVQDHLRRMGLGTEALRKLKEKKLKEKKEYDKLVLVTGGELAKLVPDAKERERLARLAASVGIKTVRG